jgi:hypothetical protein
MQTNKMNAIEGIGDIAGNTVAEAIPLEPC